MLSLLLIMATLAVPAQAPVVSPSPAAMFDQGRTWDDFLAAANARADAWRANAARSAPPKALVERLRAAAGDLRLLVVAAHACSDSAHTVPYIAALARDAGVPLRIIDATVGQSVMEAYRTPDGRAATPTVALVRGDRIVGAWVERPHVLQSWLLGPASSLPTADRMDRKFGWYEWDRGESTLAEIVDLAERLR
jgi:hypothetical protein